eukprot:2627586-Pyramimonas_sp.AAC.1
MAAQFNSDRTDPRARGSAFAGALARKEEEGTRGLGGPRAGIGMRAGAPPLGLARSSTMSPPQRPAAAHRPEDPGL